MARIINSAEPAEEPSPPTPIEWARLFVDDHMDSSGPTIRWHRDEFYKYTGKRYVTIPDSDFHAIMLQWLDRYGANATPRLGHFYRGGYRIGEHPCRSHRISRGREAGADLRSVGRGNRGGPGCGLPPGAQPKGRGRRPGQALLRILPEELYDSSGSAGGYLPRGSLARTVRDQGRITAYQIRNPTSDRLLNGACPSLGPYPLPIPLISRGSWR